MPALTESTPVLHAETLFIHGRKHCRDVHLRSVGGAVVGLPCEVNVTSAGHLNKEPEKRHQHATGGKSVERKDKGQKGPGNKRQLERTWKNRVEKEEKRVRKREEGDGGKDSENKEDENRGKNRKPRGTVRENDSRCGKEKRDRKRAAIPVSYSAKHPTANAGTKNEWPCWHLPALS